MAVKYVCYTYDIVHRSSIYDTCMDLTRPRVVQAFKKANVSGHISEFCVVARVCVDVKRLLCPVAELSGVDSQNPCGRTSSPGSLASQLCPLGPKDRCTPSQAQAMGQQVLALIAMHEANKTTLPCKYFFISYLIIHHNSPIKFEYMFCRLHPDELQNTFDIFHRCLAIAYATFFLNLYSKANAPCVLCHGCKSLYPPGQYIHHVCQALPPNIVPCRSRMWRRCLVPLVSPDVDRLQQKQRWKYVIEKFSHASMGVVRRNPLPTQTEVQLLEMPECKRGRFVKQPSEECPKVPTVYEEENGMALLDGGGAPSSAPPGLSALVNGQPSSPASSRMLLDVDVSGIHEVRSSSVQPGETVTCFLSHRKMTH